jgi:hypothetical protein
MPRFAPSSLCEMGTLQCPNAISKEGNARRQKRLEEIGLEWGLSSATWDETYALLKQSKKREGHCNVPQRHTEDGANLGM